MASLTHLRSDNILQLLSNKIRHNKTFFLLRKSSRMIKVIFTLSNLAFHNNTYINNINQIKSNADLKALLSDFF